MEPGSLFSPGRPALIVPLTGTNQVELRGQISRIPDWICSVTTTTPPTCGKLWRPWLRLSNSHG